MPAGLLIDDGRARQAIAPGLLDLAPLDLPNWRVDRYDAANVAISLEALAPPDQEIARRVYGQITQLLAVVSGEESQKTAAAGVRDFVAGGRFEELRLDLRALGQATFARREPDRAIAKAIHDVRGGALSALFMRLEFFDPDDFTRDEVRALFMLTRDHGKIMRSAIANLDSSRRRKDRVPQSHHVSLLIEKWQDAILGQLPEHAGVRVSIDCRFEGAVTECCLESAAIDRVFYNLVANALRHNAGDRLELIIFPTPRAPGENLRFVLRNAVREEDLQRIQALAGGQAESRGLDRLFEPGVSSTGSGLGLAIVADLVTQAFGVTSEKQALQSGYYGARLLEGKFTAWFHWPVGRSGLGKAAGL